MTTRRLSVLFFFFNDTATTEIYTLSLHDALPISHRGRPRRPGRPAVPARHPPRHPRDERGGPPEPDRKSTRLNSSHSQISYAVFCLKKKNNQHVASEHRHTVLLRPRCPAQVLDRA